MTPAAKLARPIVLRRRWYPPQTVVRLNRDITARARGWARGRMLSLIPRRSDGLLVGMVIGRKLS